APPGSRRRAGSAFQRVVGRFLGDLDVVGMALAVPGLGDPHEAAVGPQALDVGGTAVAHAGPQPADQLVHRLRQRAAVGNAALDAPGHGRRGVILEVAVAGPRLHGAQRAHAPVDLVGATLVDLQFAGALLGAGEEAADHDAGSAGGDGLDDVARVADAAVGDDRHAVTVGLAGAVVDGGDLGHPDPG